MKNILLVCAAGMSTSMLVKKMNDAAADKKIEARIWAVPEAELEKHIDSADVVLLGPQVRFMLDKVREAAGEKPVSVIDMALYGTMNGEKVLLSALDLIS